MSFGIDVSHYQGNIDWTRVKASGKEFAICKAMFESSHRVDEFFVRNYRGAVDNGMGVGAYIFIGSKCAENPEEDARAFLSILGNRKMDYGIWIDAESAKIRALGRDRVADIIKREMAVIRRAGYWCGIYTNPDWHKNVLTDELKREKLLVARYPKNDDGTVKPNLSPMSYAVAWQYSSKGHVDGISGNVDLDIDYAIKPKKTIDELSKEVLHGYWGTAASVPTRRQRLTAAGYDYDAVQKRVNELLRNR